MVGYFASNLLKFVAAIVVAFEIVASMARLVVLREFACSQNRRGEQQRVFRWSSTRLLGVVQRWTRLQGGGIFSSNV